MYLCVCVCVPACTCNYVSTTGFTSFVKPAVMKYDKLQLQQLVNF
jgi:hypothetical protein